MKRILTILLLLPLFSAAYADGTSDLRARELFDSVYQKVWGPQGSSLRYDVNILGIYKTMGKIVYKKQKIHYVEKRYMAWEDGVTAYMVDSKKKEVSIYRFDDDRKDNYLSKFKFDVSQFDFSYTEDVHYYYITAKVKKSGFFGIRWVEAKVLKSGFVPVSLTIKLPLMHTTVLISDFKSGDVSDDDFVFPAARFGNYKFLDYRGAS